MSAADDPRTAHYHRRITTVGADQVATLCGRVVDYQRANGSLTNVDCPACIGSADTVVNDYVASMRELLEPALAKPTPERGS